ncbi:MAG TPA: ATP-binding cassette domain-containing protein [Gemmataceae bacterium]|nr:ATP-binding cassette domain-containing protein [Gemmataceae bacterium]
MIVLENVNVDYRGYSLLKPPYRVLTGINAVLRPGDHVAILGGAGSGKTTLLRLLCGLKRPSSGRIIRESSASFPVGFGGAGGKMTVAQYIHFVAVCYAVDPKRLRDFAVEFAGIEKALDRRNAHLEADLKARLNVVLGYALPFDFYLFDNKVTASDKSFQRKCLALLEMRKRTSGIILATREPRLASRFCRSGGVLHNGRLTLFNHVEDAITFYNSVSPTEPRTSEDAYYRAI